MTLIKRVVNHLKDVASFKKFTPSKKHVPIYKKIIKRRVRKDRGIYDLEFDTYYTKKFYRGFRDSFINYNKLQITNPRMNNGISNGKLAEEGFKDMLAQNRDIYDNFLNIITDIYGSNIDHLRDPKDPNIPLVDLNGYGYNKYGKNEIGLEIKTFDDLKDTDHNIDCCFNSKVEVCELLKRSGNIILIILGVSGSQHSNNFELNGNALIVDPRFDNVIDTGSFTSDGRIKYNVTGFPFEFKKYRFI